MFLLVSLFFVLYTNTCEYTGIEQLKTLSSDPFLIMTDLENKLTQNSIKLKTEQRTALIDELNALKQERCSRPSAGLLWIPIWVTVWFGTKAFFEYKQAQFINGITGWRSLFVNSTPHVDSFLWNLIYGAISFGSAIIYNLEHRENVHSLFKKERALEKQINTVIDMLKTDESTK